MRHFKLQIILSMILATVLFSCDTTPVPDEISEERGGLPSLSFNEYWLGASIYDIDNTMTWVTQQGVGLPVPDDGHGGQTQQSAQRKASEDGVGLFGPTPFSTDAIHVAWPVRYRIHGPSGQIDGYLMIAGGYLTDSMRLVGECVFWTGLDSYMADGYHNPITGEYVEPIDYAVTLEGYRIPRYPLAKWPDINGDGTLDKPNPYTEQDEDTFFTNALVIHANSGQWWNGDHPTISKVPAIPDWPFTP